MKHIIFVKLKKTERRSYRIRIESGLLDEIPAIVKQRFKGASVFIISDTRVQRLYGRTLHAKFHALNINARLIDFAPGEPSKTKKVVNQIHTDLLSHGIQRKDVIIALGGGVVGDVAGFAAATVLRGVRYIQVPTSLLAQVDSSIGGKVGINHRIGKNLIGAFHHPEVVHIDPLVLKTLPLPEFRNGLAEVVKIAASLDKHFFRFLERNAPKILEGDGKALAEMISQSVALKAAVVGRDEKEAGLRKVLNVGHTIAHALEMSSDYAMVHGVAVAIGMAAESSIALQMGILKERDYRRLLKLLRAFTLPTKFPVIRNKERFLRALSADKKSEQGKTHYVLLEGIGLSLIGVEVPSPFITALLQR